MNGIYQWVEWFKELSHKIANNGEQFLVERARLVEWKVDGSIPPLLNYGDENIDPFFVHLLPCW